MSRLLTFVAALGRLSVPFGLFAVLAVGLHAGADRVDDRIFVLIHAVDGLVDRAGSAALTWGLGVFDASPTTVERWTFAFVDAVDLETKDVLSRWGALVLELVAVVLLTAPLLVARREGPSPRALARNLRADPTVLRVVAPLTAGLAAWAGTLVVAAELSGAVHAGLEAQASGQVTAWATRVVAAALVGLLGVRFGGRAVVRAAAWSDRVGRNMQLKLQSRPRRILKGWALLVLVFPITWLAVFEAVPPFATLRALMAG